MASGSRPPTFSGTQHWHNPAQDVDKTQLHGILPGTVQELAQRFEALHTAAQPPNLLVEEEGFETGAALTQEQIKEGFDNSCESHDDVLTPEDYVKGMSDSIKERPEGRCIENNPEFHNKVLELKNIFQDYRNKFSKDNPQVTLFSSDLDPANLRCIVNFAPFLCFANVKQLTIKCLTGKLNDDQKLILKELKNACPQKPIIDQQFGVFYFYSLQSISSSESEHADTPPHTPPTQAPQAVGSEPRQAQQPRP